MSDFELKFDPSRPAWYVSEEGTSALPGVVRPRNGLRSPLWRPPTDVYETEEAVVVRLEIAGMQEKDISISLTSRTLSIRGIRQDVPERRAYHQMEIFFGEFAIDIELPVAVHGEAVTAEYQGGFLKILLPKELPKRIRVKE